MLGNDNGGSAHSWEKGLRVKIKRTRVLHASGGQLLEVGCEVKFVWDNEINSVMHYPINPLECGKRLCSVIFSW